MGEPMKTRNPAESQRVAEIAASQLVRLRPVCLHMPEDSFLHMIDEMAAIQVKCESRASDSGIWGRVPDRM